MRLRILKLNITPLMKNAILEPMGVFQLGMDLGQLSIHINVFPNFSKKAPHEIYYN